MKYLQSADKKFPSSPNCIANWIIIQGKEKHKHPSHIKKEFITTVFFVKAHTLKKKIKRKSLEVWLEKVLAK